MNVQDVLRELDGYFQQQEYPKIEPFLLDKLAQARAENDEPSAVTLLNELMGYYRGMSRFADALAVAEQSLALMEKMGYKGSVPYGTTLLNVATAYRADGQTEKAIELFEAVQAIFTAHKLDDAYLLASLYNNLSLAFQEANRHDKAIQHLEIALTLVRNLPNSDAEVAGTYTNLALSKLKCGRVAEAKRDLLNAIDHFDRLPTVHSHYGAALAGLGEVAFKEGSSLQAIEYYKQALAQIENHYGKNMYYAVTLESLALIYEEVDSTKSAELGDEARRIIAALK